MASTNFQDYNQNTPIVSAWLNDVNDNTYSAAGVAKTYQNSAAAWVRFSVTGGVIAIQQSVNVQSVTRTGVGVYVVQYVQALTNISNCYSISMPQAGFAEYSAESTSTVTITTTNNGNVAFDPSSVSVVVFGAN